MRRLVVSGLILAFAAGAVLVAAPSADAASPSGVLHCAIPDVAHPGSGGSGGEANVVDLRFGESGFRSRPTTPGDMARKCRSRDGHPVGVTLD